MPVMDRLRARRIHTSQRIRRPSVFSARRFIHHLPRSDPTCSHAKRTIEARRCLEWDRWIRASPPEEALQSKRVPPQPEEGLHPAPQLGRLRVAQAGQGSSGFSRDVSEAPPSPLKRRQDYPEKPDAVRPAFPRRSEASISLLIAPSYSLKLAGDTPAGAGVSSADSASKCRRLTSSFSKTCMRPFGQRTSTFSTVAAVPRPK